MLSILPLIEIGYHQIKKLIRPVVDDIIRGQMPFGQEKLE